MRKSRGKGEGALFILLSLFFVFYYRYACSLSYNEIGLYHGHNFNLLAYAGSLILAFVLYVLAAFLVDRVYPAGTKHAGLRGVCSAVVLLYSVYSCIFLYDIYYREQYLTGFESTKKLFIRENYRHSQFTLVMIVLAIVTLWIIRRFEHQKEHKVWRAFLSIILSLFCTVLNFGPNPFRNLVLGIYHNDSYTTTIINTLHLQPFSDANCNIYGHYGLIYYPFVKLFGGDYTAVAITLSLFTGITMLCAFYVESGLIRNDAVFTVAALSIAGISVTYYRPMQALSVMPHRYLFPMLALAFLAWTRKRPYSSFPKRAFWELLIAVLGVVFNLETGLICAVVFGAYEFFLSWSRSAAKNWGHFILVILYAAASFLLAWGLVNLYNVAVGGTPNNIHTFIYPMEAEEVGIDTLPIPSEKSGYFLQILIFAFAAFSGMRTGVLAGRQWLTGGQDRSAVMFSEKKEKLLLMATAVSGLGALAYFMNRTAISNYSISHIQFCMILGCGAGKFTDFLKDHKVSFRKPVANFKKSLKHPALTLQFCMTGMAFFLTSWFAWEAIFSTPGAIQYRVDGIWNTASFEKSLEDFKKAVPEDTLALGIGMPEIYCQLGWDPQIYVSEFANLYMSPAGQKEVEEKLAEADAFVQMQGMGYGKEDYELISTIETDDFTAEYYQRIKEQ